MRVWVRRRFRRGWKECVTGDRGMCSPKKCDIAATDDGCRVESSTAEANNFKDTRNEKRYDHKCLYD